MKESPPATGVSGQDLIAKYIDESMPGAWLGCLSWALGSDVVLKRFEAETGVIYRAPRNGLERMIDEACGHDQAKEFIAKFLPWFNEWVWGDTSDAGLQTGQEKNG